MGPLTLSSWELVSKPFKATHASTLQRDDHDEAMTLNGRLLDGILYVDDVMLVGGNKATLEMIKGKLMIRFKMSDMGDVSRVLGMKVTRYSHAGSLIITQEDYTRRMLKYGMQDCRPLGVPGYRKELSLMQPKESPLDDEAKRRFQAIVGSAMYLSQVTRYDIPGIVFGKPTNTGIVQTTKGAPGSSHASTSVPSQDGGIQHHLQARRVRAQRALGRQLGQPLVKR